MSQIRYVCLSDTHFGEEDSLLTNLKPASSDPDPLNPSPVLVELVNCLRKLVSECNGGQKPTLILNGDILELALTTTNESAMVFERFIELVFPREGDALFDENIYYIPGNHDHHLWEVAREAQYTRFISKPSMGKDLPVPWHTTNIFTHPVPSSLLNALIKRHEKRATAKVHTAYPNFGVLNGDKSKCAVFTHGHFVEPTYHLMSIAKTHIFANRTMPQEIWNIEAENFSWIDFFWSTMGRSGEFGRDTETLYEKAMAPGGLKKLISGLATNLAEKYDLPGWGDRMEALLLRGLLNAIADRLTKRGERGNSAGPLGKEAEKGLRDYAEGPLLKQILGERKRTKPRDMTLIFGHTHKPYSEDVCFKNYPQWVNVYNSGGWVVDTVEPEPLHGGAVILLDEDLNGVSLRMYNESADAQGYAVSVEEATHAGEGRNPLHEAVASHVDPGQDPWRGFSNAVARAVHVRAQHLKARILKED